MYVCTLKWFIGWQIVRKTIWHLEIWYLLLDHLNEIHYNGKHFFYAKQKSGIMPNSVFFITEISINCITISKNIIVIILVMFIPISKIQARLVAPTTKEQNFGKMQKELRNRKFVFFSLVTLGTFVSPNKSILATVSVNMAMTYECVQHSIVLVTYNHITSYQKNNKYHQHINFGSRGSSLNQLTEQTRKPMVN